MSKLDQGFSKIEELDKKAENGRNHSPVHPLLLTLFTLLYIILVVSFPKYAFADVLIFLLYPLAVYIITDLPFKTAARRLLTVLPIILLLGIVNPFFDRATALTLFGVPVSYGVLSFLTLTLKGVLAVLATVIMTSVIGIEGFVYALRLLHVPEILTTVVMLIFRYIMVIGDEAARMMEAYKLRAPGQKGVAFKYWGTFAGQLLLRSYDRADALYESMLLRGYEGTFPEYKGQKIRAFELVLFIVLSAGLILLRVFHPAEFIGGLL